MTAALREPDLLAFPGGEAPAPAAASEALCVVCRERPRLGSLSRCKQCIKEAAAAQLAAGAEAKVRVKARAEAEEQGATKRCINCKVAKPIDDFGPHHRTKDGRRKSCRACVKKARGLARPRSPEQVEKARAAAAKPARREANRQAVASWSRRNPQAARARQSLLRAKRRGEITPPATCQVEGCESGHVVGHHSDYAKPLVVLFTCPRHHRLLHSGVALKLKEGVQPRLKRIPKSGITPEVANAA